MSKDKRERRTLEFRSLKKTCQSGRNKKIKKNKCHRFDYVKKCNEVHCPIWQSLPVCYCDEIYEAVNVLFKYARGKYIFNDECRCESYDIYG